MILSTQCQCIFRRQTGRCTESFSPHCRPLGDSKLTPEQCSSSSSSSTMYGRQEARAALSRRPHAVEKAMQMKIKKVSISYWHPCLDNSRLHLAGPLVEQEKSAGEETPAGDSLARPPHLRPHRRHRPDRQELRAKQSESARKCSQVTKSLNLQIMLGNIFIYLQIILRVSAVPVLKVAAKFISWKCHENVSWQLMIIFNPCQLFA